jgi:cytochrome c oxidase subunit 2
MSDTNNTNNGTKKAGFLTSFGFLTAGVAVAAMAYYWAKPTHKAEESSTTTSTTSTSTSATAAGSATDAAAEALKASTASTTSTTTTTVDTASAAAAAALAAKTADASSTTTTSTTTTTTSATTTAADAASAVVKSDAQIYFASGKANLSAEAVKSIAVAVAKLKANPAAKAVLSGYTDATGNAAQNELLAKERAKAVRNALREAGVAGTDDARIEMKKPETLTGSVDAEKARRVEITVK